MADGADHLENTDIEQKDFTSIQTRLDALAKGISIDGNNEDNDGASLIEHAIDANNYSTYADILMTTNNSVKKYEGQANVSEYRTAEALALQIVLHKAGFGGKAGKIDGLAGDDTFGAVHDWLNAHVSGDIISFPEEIDSKHLKYIAQAEGFAQEMSAENIKSLMPEQARLFLRGEINEIGGNNPVVLPTDTKSATALAVQVLLEDAGYNSGYQDGHWGEEDLGKAKEYASLHGININTDDNIIINAVLRKLVGEESSHSDADTGADEAEFPNAPAGLIELIEGANLTKDDITFSADGKLESVSMWVKTHDGRPLFNALIGGNFDFTNPFGQNIDDIYSFSWSREKGLYEMSLVSRAELPEDIDITNLEYLSTYNNLPGTFKAPKLKILYANFMTEWPTTLKVPSLEQLYALSSTTLPDSIDQSKLTHLRISVTEFPTGLKLENIKDLRLDEVTSVPNHFHAPNLQYLFLNSIQAFPSNASAPMLKTLRANNIESLPVGNYANSLTRLGARSLVDPIQLSDFPKVTNFNLRYETLGMTEDSFLEDMHDKPTKISINARNRDQYQYVGGRVEKISAENERLFAIGSLHSSILNPSSHNIYQAEEIDIFHADLMEITDGDSQDAVARKKVEHVISKAENTQPSGNEKFLEYLFQFLLGANVRESVTPAESANAASALAQLENSDNQLTPESTNALAGYYFRKGDFAKAEEYANLTIQRARALGNTDQSAALQENSHQILAQLSSVPRFEPGEVQNMFDTVTTLDVDLDDAHTNGAGIPEDYIDGSDVNYGKLNESMMDAFGLEYSSDFTKEEEGSGSRKKTWVTLDGLPSRPSENNLLADNILSGINRIEDVQGLSERTKLDIARSAFLDKNIRNSFFHEEEIDHEQDTRMLEREYVHAYYANLAFEGASSGREQSLSETVREYFEVSSGSDNTIDEARLNDFIFKLKQHLDGEDAAAVLYSREFFRTAVNIEKARAALKPIESFWPLEVSGDEITSAFSREALVAEDAPGFESLALFFSGNNILDPHQSAREFFLTLQEKRYGRNNQVVDMAEAFKQALEAFTNQNPAAAAALLQAESYEQLFGTPPADGEVTRAEPRQPEEIGGSPADHQKYINKARGHALQQLRLVQEAVDGFVTGMFDGVPGDVNDKAEDAFTAMIARLEDTENHPNYVLDIPFGASIDAVAKPEDPQNAAILENWEQEKHILGIRVSSEVDTNQFGSKLMGAIHGTEILTDWDFGVDNISGTNEYLISVKTDGKLRTALQESGANPATWELALREILRAGMQHTQIEGEFFNPRTAHRRGMEAFEQQEKNEEMEQLRISERFLRNHEARASSLEINGETISTFAIERQVGQETYYVHVADVSGAAIEAMPSGLGTARVFVTKGSGENAELLHERGEIEKVLKITNDQEALINQDSMLHRPIIGSVFESSRIEANHADHLLINNENVHTESYAYGQYVLHVAKKNLADSGYLESFNVSSGFSGTRDYEVFLTKKGTSDNEETLPLITDALLIERATRAVEQHLSGEAEAEEERTADFLDLFHHHSSQYEKAKEPDPTDGTATEFQHAIFEEINTSFAEIDGTDYFVLDLSHENTPTDVRVHLSGAFQAENKLYVPITGNKIPPAVVVTEDLPGGYKHEFLAIGDGKRPQEVENKYINEIISPLDAVFNPIPKLQTAPLVRHVHIAGQTAPDRVEASSAE